MLFIIDFKKNQIKKDNYRVLTPKATLEDCHPGKIITLDSNILYRSLSITKSSPGLDQPPPHTN